MKRKRGEPRKPRENQWLEAYGKIDLVHASRLLTEWLRNAGFPTAGIGQYTLRAALKDAIVADASGGAWRKLAEYRDDLLSLNADDKIQVAQLLSDFKELSIIHDTARRLKGTTAKMLPEGVFLHRNISKQETTTMRNMSFTLTTEQVLFQEKTVTRRLGWESLKPGELLRAVEKCQGLKKGEHVQELGTIRVVSVRREPLSKMLDDPNYGTAEVIREGFADVPGIHGSPHRFVDFFCKANRPCKQDWPVTRIEFEYV